MTAFKMSDRTGNGSGLDQKSGLTLTMLGCGKWTLKGHDTFVL